MENAENRPQKGENGSRRGGHTLVDSPESAQFLDNQRLKHSPLPQQGYTNAVPSSYQRRCIFGFQCEIPRYSDDGTALVRGWLGVGRGKMSKKGDARRAWDAQQGGWRRGKHWARSLRFARRFPRRPYPYAHATPAAAPPVPPPTAYQQAARTFFVAAWRAAPRLEFRCVAIRTLRIAIRIPLPRDWDTPHCDEKSAATPSSSPTAS